MANNVFANGREVSCKSGEGKTICAFPDTCFTPPENPATPPGVPIPYPNTGMDSDTTEGTKNVKISGKEIMLKNKSYFKKSTGDEAGTAAKKGVITSVNRGKVYFTSWSMDVKFEGENVVRHLDTTTHNHACSNPNEALPWPFIDSQAMNTGHPCVKSGDVKKVNDNCTTAPPEDCKTKACCKARKCMLVPGILDKSKRKCCDPETPHHIIPVQDHYQEPNIRKRIDAGKMTLEQGKKFLNRGNKTYDADKAPAICAAGADHNKPERPGRHKKHGRIGRGCIAVRNSLPGDTYKYEDVSESFSQITAYHSGCDQKCIKAQMDDYHQESSKGELRKCPLAGEEKYANEAGIGI